MNLGHNFIFPMAMLEQGENNCISPKFLLTQRRI